MIITDIFDPKNARSKNLDDYSDGKIPFVSNSNLNNGVVRYVEADDKEIIIGPCIAVNGFGFATVQLQPFVGAGNGGVHIIALHPKTPMGIMELSFYAAQINHSSWRFSYGRRAIERRLIQVELEKYNLKDNEVSLLRNKFIETTENTMSEMLALKKPAK